jgi:hypothetical protein
MGNAKVHSDLMGKELAAKTKDRKGTHTGDRHIRATPAQADKFWTGYVPHLFCKNRAAWQRTEYVLSFPL